MCGNKSTCDCFAAERRKQLLTTASFEEGNKKKNNFFIGSAKAVRDNFAALFRNK